MTDFNKHQAFIAGATIGLENTLTTHMLLEAENVDKITGLTKKEAILYINNHVVDTNKVIVTDYIVAKELEFRPVLVHASNDVRMHGKVLICDSVVVPNKLMTFHALIPTACLEYAYPIDKNITPLALNA